MSVAWKQRYNEEALFSSTFGAFPAVNSGTYVIIHWLFAAHYLEVACLFRATLSRHNAEAISCIKRRKKWLFVLNVVVHCSFVVYMVYLTMFTADFSLQKNAVVQNSVWMVAIVAISLVCILAMRHIHRCAKPLRQLGIAPDSVIMKLYVGVSIASCILSIASVVLNLTVDFGAPSSPEFLTMQLISSCNSLT